jgi:hypothetical protein
MMIYLSSTLAGIVLLIACVILFTFSLPELMHLDARWVMGQYPFISLPMMVAIFGIGFLLQFRRATRKVKREPKGTA